MKTFAKNVDTTNRAEMIDFLTNHFRYCTMNSWNMNSSYANNVKIYNLGLTDEMYDKFLDALSTEKYYDEINCLLDEFRYAHEGKWAIGFNGRSNGYLVLYSGGKKQSEYKSYCTNCGQRNFRSINETGTKCGRCGADARRDYSRPMFEYFTSTKSIDAEVDFDDWSDDELKARVELVCDFDQTCDDILQTLVSMLSESEVVEETIMVPKTVKVLRTKTA